MLPSFNGFALCSSLALILALFFGCASADHKTVENRTVFVLDDLPIVLPPSSIVKKPLTSYVLQHAVYNNEEYDFQNLIEFSQSKIEVNSLSAFGVEIFRISYGLDLEYKSSFVPQSFNPAYILFDLMLMYLPIEDLARYLEEFGLRLEETSSGDEKIRSLSYQGRSICVIVYRIDEIKFSNIVRNYTYNMKEIKD